jgi:serine/threonine-protein kinase HipA
MIHPSDAKDIEAADVYKGDLLAGTLRRLEGGTEFAYRRDYVEAGGPSVASTLPLRHEPFRQGAGSVPPFFAGLLPEGLRLAAVVAAVKTSIDDELSLLLAVADDALGDVSVVPAGAGPSEVRHGLRSDPSTVSFAALFRDSIDPEAGDLDRAVAGVQEKLSSAMISFPLMHADGPSILKLNPEGFPLAIENENWCLGLARVAGLRVPTHAVISDADQAKGLLVARFDRVPAGSGYRRVAQEDACQFLGRWPADKYRVTTNEIARRLVELASAPQAAVADLVYQAAFSWIVGNGDFHAKNFSLQWRPEEGLVAPTPVYDIVSSLPYRRLDPRMALRIDSRVSNLQGRFLVDFAARFGVPESLTRRHVNALIDRVRPHLGSVVDIGYGAEVSDRVLAEMSRRMDVLGRFE